jgi:hypothetical protein
MPSLAGSYGYKKVKRRKPRKIAAKYSGARVSGKAEMGPTPLEVRHGRTGKVSRFQRAAEASARKRMAGKKDPLVSLFSKAKSVRRDILKAGHVDTLRESRNKPKSGVLSKVGRVLDEVERRSGGLLVGGSVGRFTKPLSSYVAKKAPKATQGGASGIYKGQNQRMLHGPGVAPKLAFNKLAVARRRLGKSKIISGAKQLDDTPYRGQKKFRIQISDGTTQDVWAFDERAARDAIAARLAGS